MTTKRLREKKKNTFDLLTSKIKASNKEKTNVDNQSNVKMVQPAYDILAGPRKSTEKLSLAQKQTAALQWCSPGLLARELGPEHP